MTGVQTCALPILAGAGLAVISQLAAGFPFIFVGACAVEVALQSVALSFILARVRNAWVYLHLGEREREEREYNETNLKCNGGNASRMGQTRLYSHNGLQSNFFKSWMLAKNSTQLRETGFLSKSIFLD